MRSILIGQTKAMDVVIIITELFFFGGKLKCFYSPSSKRLVEVFSSATSLTVLLSGARRELLCPQNGLEILKHVTHSTKRSFFGIKDGMENRSIQMSLYMVANVQCN